jgi:hypothetical protein
MICSYTLPTERDAVDFVICLKCHGIKAMTGSLFNPNHVLIVYSDSIVPDELMLEFGAVKFFGDLNSCASVAEYLDALEYAFRSKKNSNELVSVSGRW